MGMEMTLLHTVPYFGIFPGACVTFLSKERSISSSPPYLVTCFGESLLYPVCNRSAFGTVCKKELRLTECLLYGKQGAKRSTHLPTTLIFQMRERSRRLGNWFTLTEFLSRSQDGHRAELGRVCSPERVPPSSAARDLLPPHQSHHSFA